MGLHLMIALAKLKLLAVNSTGSSTFPLVTALVLPFILKIPFITHTRSMYSDIVAASRLFFFRLSIIIHGGESSSTGSGHNHRWERAFRLIRERISNRRRLSSLTQSQQEDSLHAASMLAL
ncbi:hypothetical protein Sjap_020262 [Stephania japonica]|uniref:Uncharacterized protein n=1 Tax=Stephania japonica TaxID=461633 RepID=A0AAP0F5M0_9MAGN